MSKKVIVLNNSNFNRKFIVDSLEKMQYQVVAALATPDDVFNVISSYDFDIFILDLVLPRYSGLELFKRLKVKSDVIKDKKVILTTSLNAESVIMDALGSGIDDVLVSPFDELDLEKSMERICPK